MPLSLSRRERKGAAKPRKGEGGLIHETIFEKPFATVHETRASVNLVNFDAPPGQISQAGRLRYFPFPGAQGVRIAL